jgi:hypothetical protein
MTWLPRPLFSSRIAPNIKETYDCPSSRPLVPAIHKAMPATVLSLRISEQTMRRERQRRGIIRLGRGCMLQAGSSPSPGEMVAPFCSDGISFQLEERSYQRRLRASKNIEREFRPQRTILPRRPTPPQARRASHDLPSLPCVVTSVGSANMVVGSSARRYEEEKPTEASVQRSAWLRPVDLLTDLLTCVRRGVCECGNKNLPVLIGGRG